MRGIGSCQPAKEARSSSAVVAAGTVAYQLVRPGSTGVSPKKRPLPQVSPWTGLSKSAMPIQATVPDRARAAAVAEAGAAYGAADAVGADHQVLRGRQGAHLGDGLPELDLYVPEGVQAREQGVEQVGAGDEEFGAACFLLDRSRGRRASVWPSGVRMRAFR
ncbi:hypothetical protein SMICM304S_06112 [Streptomyces microflavus]